MTYHLVFETRYGTTTENEITVRNGNYLRRRYCRRKSVLTDGKERKMIFDVNLVCLTKGDKHRLFVVDTHGAAREVGTNLRIPDFADYWLALREDGWQ